MIAFLMCIGGAILTGYLVGYADGTISEQRRNREEK